MSIILSKTLQNYPVDGVDAFNIYEVNITELQAGDGNPILDVGSPLSGGAFLPSWIGYYAGTGIEHDIHRKTVGDYATVLELQPGIPRGSLRSFNLNISFENISGYNQDVSAIVGTNFNTTPD